MTCDSTRAWKAMTRDSTRTWEAMTLDLTRLETWWLGPLVCFFYCMFFSRGYHSSMIRAVHYVCKARAPTGSDRLRFFFVTEAGARTDADDQWIIIMATAAVHSSTPRIIQFGYKNYHSDGKRRSAQCKTCLSSITDKEGTTSNFVRHLKTHEDK